MINKIKELFQSKYNIQISSKEVWMSLILIGSLILLAFVVLNDDTKKSVMPEELASISSSNVTQSNKK